MRTRMPSSVIVPGMRLGSEPDWWSTWTRQPGDSETLHSLVVGPAATTVPVDAKALAERAVEAASRGASSLGIGPAFGRQISTGAVRLRQYQIDCCDAVQTAWSEGKRAPLTVLPTGAGKTLIASEMIARASYGRGLRTLFLAHRKELLDQTAAKVGLVSPDTRVGIVQGPRDVATKMVTVASIQTLGHPNGKRLNQILDAGGIGLLILDEAHHAVSRQWIKVIDAIRTRCPNVLMMGMTATPGREDGIALDRVFDTVAFERNLVDMINEGWLVPPKGFRVTIDVDLNRVDTDGGDFVGSQLSKVMNTPHVNRAVVRAWMKHGHDRKMLVFAVDVAHAEALAAEFRDAGYPAAHVAGSMKPKERQKALDDFRNGFIRLLVSCNVLAEGYDDPSAEGIVFARPTQSQALFIQALGRALRLYPGKTEAIVIDCVGNSEKHKPVQLASLVGFDPKRGFFGAKPKPEEEDDEDNEAILPPTVEGADLGRTYEVHITKRVASARYKWRETKFGWVLQIPRIGYYLVAWSDKNHTRATIRFYDQREGRKKEPPREVLRDPVTFEMAYGMVESEADRLFRASERRDDLAPLEDMPTEALVDLDEGVDEDISIPESWVLRDAHWRTQAMTVRQRQLLVALGVREATMPDTAGEASDLITILRVERDVQMRLPATEKQLAYLRRWNLPYPDRLTKGAAAKMIYEHRVNAGFQEPRR